MVQVLVLSNITAAALSMAIGAALPSVALANMVRSWAACRMEGLEGGMRPLIMWWSRVPLMCMEYEP